MCGIIGFSGHQSKNAINAILKGLAHLEYRGYDSAGISYCDQQQLKTVKQTGKLQNLSLLFKDKTPKTSIAIGHTRWATHGTVNTLNAHPHINNRIAVVHNGIIENAHELKKKLSTQGITFSSETDTEAFLRLIEVMQLETKTFPEAISLAFSKVQGNSAFVILDKEDQTLYGIRHNAPLVCGINNERQELFLSSDPYALVDSVEELFFPQNDVLCIVKKNNTHFIWQELNGKPSNRFSKQVNQSKKQVTQKGNFKHFMLKEIYEQPSLIKNLYSLYSQPELQKNLKKLGDAPIHFATIVACGTAFYAGLLLKQYLSQYTKIKVSVEYASEFRYSNYQPNKNEVAFLISQSGETADTLACLSIFNQHKIPGYAILNVKNSTLYRQSTLNFLTYAGFEIGVASTKAFTQQVLVSLIIASFLGKKTLDSSLQTELTLLSQKMDLLLERHQEIKKIARQMINHKAYIFTGRQDHFPIALEGALKMKEITYMQSQGYASGELKHGPISLIDVDIANIALVSPSIIDKTISNLQEIKTRNGFLITVGPQQNAQLKEISDIYLELNFEGLKYTAPLLSNLALQLLSYEVALIKGTDIDKPRNLAKSVTVE